MAETPERIEDHSIIEEMQDSYLTYAMSVITARALPDGRDGLKPSQRRILVAMNDLNLGPRSQHRKCAKIAGDTAGNYHPHGDQVIYPTLVRMAQPWNMRKTLVDGQGNFGSMDGDAPAAMRYTEARLTAASMDMLADLEFETVDFEPNYDGTRTEPVVLPSKFPNLLVNGTTGIAVGMATSLAPHNVGEVCEALIAYVNNPQLTTAELLKIMPGPDFPTGGEIMGRRGIVDAYTTGRGSITIRGKVEVEEGKGGKKTIVISEVPYQVLRSTIVERTGAAVKGGQIKDIAAVNDASDRNHPVRIEVDLKRDANEEVVINQLYQYTPLQSNFTIMNTALVDRQPKTLTLIDMLGLYVDYRKSVIRRRTQFLLRRAKQKAHVLEGLIFAVGDIDEIIQLIKSSPDPDTARERLMARELRLSEDAALRRLLPDSFVKRYDGRTHRLTIVQANAILSMQLQRLTGLEIEKLARDYGKLVEEIEGYEAILHDEALILDIIREDLYEMKEKYADKRRTRISEAVGEFRMEELIPDEQVIVTISHEGYIKRVDVDTYRKQGRGGKGVKGSDTKEGDFLEHLFIASTHDYLLFFTNRGRVYWQRVYDIPALQRTSRGKHIANLLQMLPAETHRAILPVKRFEENFVFFATAKGTVKKTPLNAFSNPRQAGIIAITLDPDDALVGVEMTTGDDEIVLGSRDGMAVRFKETDVRAMGRSAAGVRGMTLEADDRVVGLIAIPKPLAVSHEPLAEGTEPPAASDEPLAKGSELMAKGYSVLTVCENGYGKRTDVAEYRLTKRGGKGVINIKTTERNGRVIAIRAVQDTDGLMLITAKGIMLRTDLKDLREIGRATQGVRLIRLDEGDTVVGVAKIVQEDEEDGSPSAGGADSQEPERPTESDAEQPGGDSGRRASEAPE